MTKSDYVFLSGLILTISTTLLGELFTQISVNVYGFTCEFHGIIMLFSHLSLLVAGVGCMIYGMVLKIKEKE